MSQEIPSTLEQIPILISLIIDDKCKIFMSFIKRKLEAVAVMVYVFFGLVFPIMTVLMALICIFSPLFPIAALYGYWFYCDFKTPERGSRQISGIRDWYIWRMVADYFPIQIIKTADLPPNRNYIIGCHPHGIGSFGSFISLCTNGNDFEAHFPNIQSTIATMNGMFYFPLRREQLIAHGLIAVSNESLNYYLNSGVGKAVGIVIGGAEEVLEAHPGRHDLILRNRKGFVRAAFRHGAALVPMYCFGENELYSQIPNETGSFIREVQKFIKRFLNWSPTLIYGSLWCGLLPKRKPINCVFGRPIPVMKKENPSEKDVIEIHRQYCTELENLFNQFKTEFDADGKESLNFK